MLNNMHSHHADKLRFLLPVVVVLGLFIACFSGVIFHNRLFAFRDAAHFYYPLFAYIQQTWEAGQIPWWNPYENGGMPIGANPAASLFYPGKAIFFLIHDFDAAYRTYILVHVLLTAFWAYRLARHWNASQAAATLAAITYTFSGAVLIQYSNVIFLVGAAWLPAGILAADRMLRHRCKRDAFFLGTVCALVTLGGDPQTAYHLGLLVLLLFALRTLRRRSLSKKLPTSKNLETPCAARNTANWKLLGITLLTGLLLAAIQIVPTVSYLLTTDRSSDQIARSLYEVPKMLGKEEAGRRIADGLLCRNLEQPGHLRSVYEFSIGPWRFAEMVWPNCYGRQFPIHRRWIQALPGEGRVWTPTLYAGIIPLGFALSVFQLRRRKRKNTGALYRRWMSWTLLLGLLGSLGYYGLVWGIEEITGPTPSVGAPVGGLYWLMTILLPGYVYFRYPAKLLTLVALALAMLAARGWDDFFTAKQVRATRIFFGITAISLAVLIGFLLAKPAWNAWISTTPACPIFGPLDVKGAFYDTFFGLVQTIVISGIACLLLRIHGSGKRSALPLLLLAAFDIGLANYWIVATAPAELWRTKPILTQEEGQPTLQVYRWPRLYDPQWKKHGSENRLAEEVRWNCLTLYPKYNLLHRIGVVNSYGTMMSAEHRKLLRAAPIQVMQKTNATIAILPRDATLPGGERLTLPKDFTDSEFSVWRLEVSDDNSR